MHASTRGLLACCLPIYPDALRKGRVIAPVVFSVHSVPIFSKPLKETLQNPLQKPLKKPKISKVCSVRSVLTLSLRHLYSSRSGRVIACVTLRNLASISRISCLSQAVWSPAANQKHRFFISLPPVTSSHLVHGQHDLCSSPHEYHRNISSWNNACKDLRAA